MSALIRAVLSTQSVKLQPGEKADLTLTVQNFSDIVDRFKIAVEGVEPNWVTLSRSELSLFPKDQDQVRLTLAPPAGSAARAGSYEVRIQVISLENPSERTTVPLPLEIAALGAFEATLLPQMQSGLREGVFSVQLSNGGNSDMTVQLAAVDPEEGCLYTFSPPQVALPAGQERLVQLTVRPKSPRPPKGGKTYAFTVTARPEELRQQGRQVPGQWQQLAPRRRTWPILVGVAAGLLALVALGYFVILPLVQSGLPLGPTLPVTLPATPITPLPTTAVPAASRVPIAVPTRASQPPRGPTGAPTGAPTWAPTGFPVPSIRIVQPALTLRPVRPVALPTLASQLNLIPAAQSARWINDENTVLAFGQGDATLGSAAYADNVVMEDGQTYAQVLVTNPHWVDNGAIQGDFSVQPYVVSAGDVLVVSAGLAQGASGSDGVLFRVLLSAQSNLLASVHGGGGAATIWEATDTYDGQLVNGRISLDPWVGRTVWFLIQVMANGSSGQDWAVWTKLQVER